MTPGKTKAANRGQSGTLSVTLALPLDPQVLLAITPRIRLSRAEDEAGRSLLLPPDPDRTNSEYGNGVFQQIDVFLRAPEEGSRELTLLEGVTTFLLTDKREHWEIADLMKTQNAAHAFASGGQNLTALVVGAQKKGTTLQLDFQLRAPNAIAFNEGTNPFFSLEQIAASVHLRDAKGRTLSPGGYNGSVEWNGCTLQLRFSLPATDIAANRDPVVNEPVKFIFDAPVEFVQTEVPFSFSDLPLP